MPLSPEIRKLMLDINKSAGTNLVVLGSEVVPFGRITTGSVALDTILGGGWPTNQFCEIIGEASHGKTALMYKTIAANQEKDSKFTTVWLASEPYNPDYAEMCGVDNSRIILIETTSMEDGLDNVLKFMDSQQADLVVIDSLPALVVTSEDEKSMGESTVGRNALLINKFFRKAGKAIKRNTDGTERPVTVLIINQWRMLIGVTHGDPRTTPGGKGKDFSYAVRLEVRRGEWIEVGPSSSKIKVGQQLKAKTIKNKTAPPFQAAAVDFYFADGGEIPAGEFDSAKEAIAVAKALGLFEMAGSWINYRERKWQGVQRMVEDLREDIDLRDALYADILTATQVPTPSAA